MAGDFVRDFVRDFVAHSGYMRNRGGERGLGCGRGSAGWALVTGWGESESELEKVVRESAFPK